MKKKMFFIAIEILFLIGGTALCMKFAKYQAANNLTVEQINLIHSIAAPENLGVRKFFAVYLGAFAVFPSLYVAFSIPRISKAVSKVQEWAKGKRKKKGFQDIPSK
ncbi:hypothetical protein D1872_156590 [compost metagenome]